MNLSFDLGMVETTMLAGMRLIAFLVVAPPFHVKAFPGPVKMALALGLALVAGPRAAEAAGAVPGAMLASGSMQFLGALVLEIVVGLGLGFLVRLVFAAVQAAGGIIDVFGGFQMAQGFDPLNQTQGSVFAKFYDFTAMALLFASNGHQLVLGGLVRSFDALPLGNGFNTDAMGHLLTSGLARAHGVRAADRRAARGGALPRRRRPGPPDACRARAQRLRPGLPAQDLAHAFPRLDRLPHLPQV